MEALDVTTQILNTNFLFGKVSLGHIGKKEEER